MAAKNLKALWSKCYEVMLWVYCVYFKGKYTQNIETSTKTLFSDVAYNFQAQAWATQKVK